MGKQVKIPNIRVNSSALSRTGTHSCSLPDRELITDPLSLETGGKRTLVNTASEYFSHVDK